MDLSGYAVILRRYWWIIVILTVVGAGTGYVTALITTPLYESTARLFVTTQGGTSVGEAYENNLFSQERVVSYAGLAASEQVAARTVDHLNAQISVDDLRKKISATPVAKTVLLDVNVTDPDPGIAQTYANAVSEQLVQVVSELETSRRGGTPAAGAVIVDDADYPTIPVGMTPLARVLLGAAFGLAAGILAALATGLLDRRLRGPDAVERVTGSLLLGALPDDPSARRNEIVDLAAGGSVVERLRQLRTNLRSVVTPGSDGAPRVIAVTSPSHGDGRTTTAVDLAVTLAEAGRSVILVDGDLRAPALADRLPLDDDARSVAAQRGLATVLVGEHELADVVLNAHAGAQSIALLPAGPIPVHVGELWARESAPDVIKALSAQFDYVVIDTPPLTSYTDGAIAASLGDGAIVLARIRHTTNAALRAALRALDTANATVIGVVATGERAHRPVLGRRHRTAPSEGSGQAQAHAHGDAAGNRRSRRRRT